MYIDTQQPGTDVKGPFEEDPELYSVTYMGRKSKKDINIRIADRFTAQEK